MSKHIDAIAGEIMGEMEKLLLERVYIAIIKEGTVLYASSALDKHIELLKLFNITEFQQLRNLDHAFPLSGTNLAIFKLDDLLVALYTKKGYQGQLLSFKTKVNKYLNDLRQAAVAPPPQYMEAEDRGQIRPKLTQTVSLTMGMSEDESAVLKLCDGNHSIREIIVKARVPRKNVVDIVRHFEKKGWLKLEYQGDVEIIPISIKKFPETAVRLGMISKKSYDINELCNGMNTVKDIARKLIISERELNRILKKMEKNKIIKMTLKIPEEEPVVPAEIREEVQVTPLVEAPNPELHIKPIMTANVSFTMGFDKNEEQVLKLLDGSHSIIDLYHVTQIPIIDIFGIIIKYEEKGWIRIPIDDFMHIVTLKEKLKSAFDTAELAAVYQKVAGKQVATSDTALETAISALEETPAADETLERENLQQRIQETLPLMPIAAQTKLIDKLIKLSAHSREGMLDRLINSESSNKFRVPATPAVPSIPQPAYVIPAPTAPPAPPPMPREPAPPAPTIPQPPPATPIPKLEPAAPPLPSQAGPIAPVIDETPLIKPSSIVELGPSSEPIIYPLPDDLISPKVLQSPLEKAPMPKLAPPPPLPPAAPAAPPTPPAPAKPRARTDLLSGSMAAEEDQISEVLNFIDSLLGIPEILYLALIDYGGTIFYQTTKEAELWDISKDTLKLIQNWQSQAPSVYLGDNIKYAVIKTEPNMLIATNVKGFGHIVTIPINEKLFILTKVNKEGDALLIADDVAIVAKQINEMFGTDQLI
ncbi:MAG: hypothetical protein HWN65_02045 [Candidatus Helarchaeota archaeon]|nr:hypothetical protein [Candidatus Helarchaeota archaeon]